VAVVAWATPHRPPRYSAAIPVLHPWTWEQREEVAVVEAMPTLTLTLT
jgi:hypothetical protein